MEIKGTAQQYLGSASGRAQLRDALTVSSTALITCYTSIQWHANLVSIQDVQRSQAVQYCAVSTLPG
jgi:hypothetical protein